MANNRTIYRGTARSVEVTVRSTTNAAGWTLKYVLGYTDGSVGSVVMSLSYQSVSSGEYLFTTTLTAAQSQTLVKGRSVEGVVWRTDSGSESVLGEPQSFEVDDTPRAA